MFKNTLIITMFLTVKDEGIKIQYFPYLFNYHFQNIKKTQGAIFFYEQKAFFEAILFKL